MKAEIQTTIQNATSGAGAVAASTGIVHYLSENASVIGLGFTAATFLVYALSTAFGNWLKWKNQKAGPTTTKKRNRRNK